MDVLGGSQDFRKLSAENFAQNSQKSVKISVVFSAVVKILNLGGGWVAAEKSTDMYFQIHRSTEHRR